MRLVDIDPLMTSADASRERLSALLDSGSIDEAARVTRDQIRAAADRLDELTAQVLHDQADALSNTLATVTVTPADVSALMERVTAFVDRLGARLARDLVAAGFEANEASSLTASVTRGRYDVVLVVMPDIVRHDRLHALARALDRLVRTAARSGDRRLGSTDS
jgi:hypothetical protein